MIGSQKSFPRAYSAQTVDYPPHGATRRVEAPGSRSRASTVLIEPDEADAWYAVFAAPDPGVRALTAIHGTPAVHRVCVLERGAVFLGDVREPDSFEYLDTYGPVVDVTEAVDEELLLLATRFAVTAVDCHGHRWTTKRLAIDGLRVDEVSSGWLHGVADPADDEPRDFAVELETGQVSGGAGVSP